MEYTSYFYGKEWVVFPGTQYIMFLKNSSSGGVKSEEEIFWTNWETFSSVSAVYGEIFM